MPAQGAFFSLLNAFRCRRAFAGGTIFLRVPSKSPKKSAFLSQRADCFKHPFKRNMPSLGLAKGNSKSLGCFREKVWRQKKPALFRNLPGNKKICSRISAPLLCGEKFLGFNAQVSGIPCLALKRNNSFAAQCNNVWGRQGHYTRACGAQNAVACIIEYFYELSFSVCTLSIALQQNTKKIVLEKS